MIKKIILINLFVSFLFLIYGKDGYTINENSSWVKQIKFEDSNDSDNIDDNSGKYYLLYDCQTKVFDNTVEYFEHHVYKFTNDSGIENNSQLEFEFDPSYQSLIFHKIIIHRGKEIINQLIPKKIELFQREKQREYLLYDGTKSANIILDDIRVGDILEYSFTIKGYNPVFENKFFYSFNTQWSIPIKKASLRLLYPQNRTLNIFNFKKEINYNLIKSGDYSEYTWTLENIQALLEDTQLPAWYDAYSWIQFTELNNWAEINDWALKIYKINDDTMIKLKSYMKEIIPDGISQEEKILTVIRFVQDKIRYLGIEIGKNSHSPTDPLIVLKRRFGDCKDKSLLLVAMLRVLGIESYPSLVNTYLNDKINNYRPSPFLFNHVIVKAIINNKIYWIDSTMINQRGKLNNFYQPDYGMSLVISEKTKDLTKFNFNDLQSPTIINIETYNLSNQKNKTCLLDVKCIYSGKNADIMRNTFAQNSKASLQKDYLNFYANSYHSISVSKEMQINDNSTDNIFIDEEQYIIQNPWEKKNTKSEFNIFPSEIASYLKNPENISRTMPLKIIYPLNIEQQIKVILPDNWDIKNENKEIKNSVFIYNYEIKSKKNEVVLKYNLKTLTDHVDPDYIKKYVEDLEYINDNLLGYSFYFYGELTKQQKDFAKMNSSQILAIIFIFVVIIVIFIIRFKADKIANFFNKNKSNE